MSFTKCIVLPLSDKYLPIDLNNNKPVVVGRSKETKIKIKGCSRNQVQLTANFDLAHVIVEQTGPNSSAINSEIIGMGLCKIAKDGDIIDLVVGEEDLKFKVTFEGTVKHGNGDTSEGGGNPKAVKIPKMFLSKSEFSKSSSAQGSWDTFDSKKIMVYKMGESILEPKSFIYGFDMDGTLITTKSGAVFPKNENDWRFLYNTTINKLKKTFEENKDAKFVIITNQLGISNGKTQVPSFKKKIETITDAIGIPVVVFVLYGKNEYRKPLPALWNNVLIPKYNADQKPDIQNSLYVGDAAGRKKDHSKSDRLFALNLSLPFNTPEEFFLGQKPQEYNLPLLNPKQVLEQQVSNTHITFTHSQECIIMVGFPGSGKSWFFNSVLKPKSYVHINRDEMKTAAKCKSAAEASLRNGQSIVVDNTNPTVKDRSEYIQLAKKLGVSVRCFLMKVDHTQALHNNKFRELTKDTHTHVPDVAFNSYKSKYQEPTMTEGYNEIVPVYFVPHFEEEKTKQLYSLYLLEK